MAGEPAGGEPPATGLAFSLLLVLGALSAFGPLSTDMYLPGLPSLARGLSVTPSLAQLTISVSLVGLAVGQLLIGPLSDSRGRRGPLLTGMGIYLISSAGCAAAPSIVPLLLLRLVQGAAGGAGIALARAIVRDRTEGEVAARAYAALMLVGGLGPILAPVAGGLLLHITDWRGIFATLAVIGALLYAAVLVFVPETLPAGRRHGDGVRGVRDAMGILFHDRRYVGHALAGSFAFGTLMAYIAASPFVLERIHGLSPGTYSLVFAANGCSILLGRQIAASRLDRITPRRIMRIGLAVQALAGFGILAVVVSGLGLAWLLAGFFIAVGANGAIIPMGVALAMADHPERAGSASGLVGFTQFLLGSLVAPLVGVAGPGSALPMAILMPACSLGGVAAFAFAGSAPRA